MMYNILGVLILTISYGFFVIEAQKFRCDYDYDTDSKRWYKLHLIPADWHEAQLRCYLEGGVLASPLNLKVKEAMQNVMKNASIKCGVFTGFHATFSRGDFFSVEGMPLHSIPQTWAEDEPDNNKNEESCITMLPDGLLADVDCNEPHAYICYKRKTKDMPWNQLCGISDLGYTYDSRTGHCYKFHRVPRIWSRAYMACAAEGGYLAIINSDAEAAILKDLYAKNPDNSMRGNFQKVAAFIGIHDWDEHGDWRTIDGLLFLDFDTEKKILTEAGYDKFSNGQPDNSTKGQFCGAVFRTGLLDDMWCDSTGPFFCEKKPDSLCPTSDHDDNDY